MAEPVFTHVGAREPKVPNRQRRQWAAGDRDYDARACESHHDGNRHHRNRHRGPGTRQPSVAVIDALSIHVCDIGLISGSRPSCVAGATGRPFPGGGASQCSTPNPVDARITKRRCVGNPVSALDKRIKTLLNQWTACSLSRTGRPRSRGCHEWDVHPRSRAGDHAIVRGFPGGVRSGGVLRRRRSSAPRNGGFAGGANPVGHADGDSPG